jgi:hypothetical protein
VDSLTDARQRVAAATDLSDILDAAYDALEDMLAVIRRHQEDDESRFPAFVMAASAAANGRDWIAGADAVPPGRPREHTGDLPSGDTVTDVAIAVATLSREVAGRLTDILDRLGSSPGDRLCCDSAAAEAAIIAALLDGTSPP